MMRAILEDVGSTKVTLTNVKDRVVVALGQKADDTVLEALTGVPCRSCVCVQLPICMRRRCLPELSAGTVGTHLRHEEVQ